MYRPAIGTLIVAAILGMAGPAPAELPMSPIYRTDHPTKPDQPRAAPAASTAAATAAATQGTSSRRATIAQPLPDRPTTSGEAVDATADDAARVVATAPIPPPLPAAEPETLPSTNAPQRVAKTPRKLHHAPRRRYAYARYPVYRPMTGWGSGWAASGGAHLGPNPYSPNGGD